MDLLSHINGAVLSVKKKLFVTGADNEYRFVKNLGWLGASEFFVRITRLLTAVVLARLMDPMMFGLAALVLTVNELLRVFNRNGISAKIVQCQEHELESITNTAYRLNFIFCISLFVIQCAVAYPLAQFYATPELVPMLQVLAVTYLLMPFGMVQAALVQREQRLKTAALIDGGQVGVDNLITTGLALAGLGAWAIVLPKFLTSPIWVFGYRAAHSWKPSGKVSRFDLWRDVLSFGRYYLSIEILKVARLNIDNMVIGRLLGMEALGIYYFARNAGLGFSLTLINAINSALYPNLCELKDNTAKLKQRFNQNLKHIAMIAAPLITLQASLAFLYVPIVFGEQWSDAIPILAILCLSALPRPLAESASALALATGHIKLDYRWNQLFTVGFIVAIIIASHIDLLTVAITLLVIYTVTQPVYLIYVWRTVFGETASNQLTRGNISMLNKDKQSRVNRDAPLVSVVIPVYNVQDTIDQAVSSVISQSYSNLEILIIDDESPDCSIQRVDQRFPDRRIRIIRQSNRGLAGARNTGIRYAKGDYIAFLDSDDFWQPNKLEEHMKVMQSTPSCGVTFSASQFVDQLGRALGRIQAPKKKANFAAKDIFCRNPIGNGSSPVIRRDVLEKIQFRSPDKHNNGVPYSQYFDEQLRQSEDVDCWTRIAIQTNTKFEYIDKPLTNYRINSSGLSANVDKQFETWLALLNKLERSAPEFAKKYGPVAKAYQYRYLARRCLFQGQAKLACQYMIKAFKAKPLALTREAGRTLETALASIGMAILPRQTQLKLLEKVVK